MRQADGCDWCASCGMCCSEAQEFEICPHMNIADRNDSSTQWFAIRTRQDFQAEEALAPLCDEVFFPKETVRVPGKRPRVKAAIPHVLFIKTTAENALSLERDSAEKPLNFWIYRYPLADQIQVIPERSIDLLRLLTVEDSTKCEIFSKAEFNRNDHVEITDGIFKGYTGYVQRVRKNRHVIVEIEGICAVLLPYIHPDLLEKIE